MSWAGAVMIWAGAHPPPDTPQKKNEKTHRGDPHIYQVEGIDIPKQKWRNPPKADFLVRLI